MQARSTSGFLRRAASVVLAGSLSLGMFACETGGSTRSGTPAEADVDLLADYLTGSFSSAEQAAGDPENFLDIRLHTAEIWTDRDDGPWLYVEQAAASAMDRPYRQRVYRLSEPSPGVFVSDVYLIPSPLDYAGWWRTPERFDGALGPDDLTPREGCSIRMTAQKEPGPEAGGATIFVGSTRGTACESGLRDAAYATSHVELFPDRLKTWDRGYKASGEQVWGAMTSGYVFVRVGE